MGDPRARNLYFDMTQAAEVVRGNQETLQSIAGHMRRIGMSRIYFGSDSPRGAGIPPKASWEKFLSDVPLTRRSSGRSPTTSRPGRAEAAPARAPDRGGGGLGRADGVPIRYRPERTKARSDPLAAGFIVGGNLRPVALAKVEKRLRGSTPGST